MRSTWVDDDALAASDGDDDDNSKKLYNMNCKNTKITLPTTVNMLFVNQGY
jgi:hypothetical protein